jgi:cation:H+ antiporter
MIDLSHVPLYLLIGGFAVAGLVIALAGTRLSGVADDLADRTGAGEALVGALLLGGTTSLPGIVTSVTAAWGGYADLAISNAIGGIAAQTAFIAVADTVYRRANLEHAAASLSNLVQGALLICMLSIPVIAYTSPDFVLAGISIFSPLMLAGYVSGLIVSRQVRDDPMWTPHRTRETQVEEEETAEPDVSMRRLAFTFAGLALLTGLAGYALTQCAVGISQQTGLSQTATGGLLTAVVTSLPELVTSIAAVRRGALTLAVGGIIGGNAFDVLFLAFADVAYRQGSLYEALTSAHLFVIAVSILMTGVLVMGLLKRERHGPASIGFESMLILIFYAAAVTMLGST